MISLSQYALELGVYDISQGIYLRPQGEGSLIGKHNCTGTTENRLVGGLGQRGRGDSILGGPTL